MVFGLGCAKLEVKESKKIKKRKTKDKVEIQE